MQKEIGDYVFTMDDGDPGWTVQAKNKKRKRYAPIPAEVNGIPVYSLKNAFIGCSLMEEAPTIPEGVEDISHAFEGCTRLKVAPTLPQSVREMSWAFRDCIALRTPPVIPNGVYDMRGAFTNCVSLSVAPTIPDGVKCIAYAFENCVSLSVPPVIPASVEDKENVFDGCCFTAKRICPKCKRAFSEKPALSRIDGADICPECGTIEALDAAPCMPAKTKEKILEIVQRLRDNPDEANIKMWARVGVTFFVSEAERKVLWSQTEESADLLRQILTDPTRAQLDGETYIPESDFAGYTFGGYGDPSWDF